MNHELKGQPIVSALFAKPMSILLVKVIKHIKFISPNVLTLISLIFRILSAVFIVKFQIIPIIIFSYLAHVLDWSDGLLARETNKSSKFGEVFDITVDRVGATVQLTALAYLLIVLNRPISSVIIFVLMLLHLHEIGLYELCQKLKEKKGISEKDGGYNLRIKQFQSIFGKKFVKKLGFVVKLIKKYKINPIPTYIEAYYILFVFGPLFKFHFIIIILGFLSFISQFMFTILRLYFAVKK